MGQMLIGTEHYGSPAATYGEAWHCGSAEQEARSLLPLLRTAGQTVADVLDLIRVGPEEEKRLRAFAEKFHELKLNVERSLNYRIRVEKEFCRLVGDGASAVEQGDRRTFFDVRERVRLG
jgi:hypothetical protein